MGWIDIILAGVMFFAAFGIGSPTLLAIVAAYLLVKGFFYLPDVASIFDVLAGAVLAFGLLVALPKLVFVIVGVVLIQKGILSVL